VFTSITKQFLVCDWCFWFYFKLLKEKYIIIVILTKKGYSTRNALYYNIPLTLLLNRSEEFLWRISFCTSELNYHDIWMVDCIESFYDKEFDVFNVFKFLKSSLMQKKWLRFQNWLLLLEQSEIYPFFTFIITRILWTPCNFITETVYQLVFIFFTIFTPHIFTFFTKTFLLNETCSNVHVFLLTMPLIKLNTL
jgi:hypothetical protein